MLYLHIDPTPLKIALHCIVLASYPDGSRNTPSCLMMMIIIIIIIIIIIVIRKRIGFVNNLTIKHCDKVKTITVKNSQKTVKKF